MDRQDYDAALQTLRRDLRVAQIAMFRQKRRAIVVLEGYDAAGKGGVIRELSYAWDPRGFCVHPIGPPSPAERQQPFLWRFWQRLPELGQIAVFDRSWYGRLLVERVEAGLSDEAYDQSVLAIQQFEAQLMQEGFQILKLFLDINETTQRQRLRHRAEVPEKRWKLTASDLDSLAVHAEYELAVQRMLLLCNEPPWQVVDCNDKRAGRLQVLHAIKRSLNEQAAARTFAFNPGVENRLFELGNPITTD